jgi:hypothetical protein
MKKGKKDIVTGWGKQFLLVSPSFAPLVLKAPHGRHAEGKSIDWIIVFFFCKYWIIVFER